MKLSDRVKPLEISDKAARRMASVTALSCVTSNTKVPASQVVTPVAACEPAAAAVGPKSEVSRAVGESPTPLAGVGTTGADQIENAQHMQPPGGSTPPARSKSRHKLGQAAYMRDYRARKKAEKA